MPFSDALKTSLGMSLYSMISMEISIEPCRLYFSREAKLVFWVVPIMLLAGFITPLPYNYWRLKALGKSCH